jgi:hypothetical protein
MKNQIEGGEGCETQLNYDTRYEIKKLKGLGDKNLEIEINVQLRHVLK